MSKSQRNKRNFRQNDKRKYEYDSSDDENTTDSYQHALMSSLVALSNKNKESSSEDKEKKPTDTRIEFVKNILDGNKLNSLVDFDSCNTESVTSTKLNKKIMDFKELILSMNVKLRYLKSGTTGHTFKA